MSLVTDIMGVVKEKTCIVGMGNTCARMMPLALSVMS